jgi:hypothetical protein
MYENLEGDQLLLKQVINKVAPYYLFEMCSTTR